MIFLLKQDLLFQCEYCFNEGLRFKGNFLAKEKTDILPTDSVLPLLDQGRRNPDNITITENSSGNLITAINCVNAGPQMKKAYDFEVFLYTKGKFAK